MRIFLSSWNSGFTLFMYVVDSTLLQVKGVVERKMKERKLNRNSRGG